MVLSANTCCFEREANGNCAIGLDDVLDGGGFEAGFNLGEDRHWIFGAWIVAGGNHVVASLACGLTHFGALGAVAVAAAAEERDDMCAGFCGHLAGEMGEVLQRIVSVGVVDDHGEGLAGVDK